MGKGLLQAGVGNDTNQQPQTGPAWVPSIHTSPIQLKGRWKKRGKKMVTPDSRLKLGESKLFDMAVEVNLIVLYKIREGESGRKNSYTIAAQALS